MPAIDAHPAGTINWLDLSTTDIEGATVFYAGVFGWDIDGEDTPMGRYYVAEVGDHDVAGMMEMSPEHQATGIPASWTVFFRSEDIDATLARVEDAGGKVLQPPMALPDEGRIAVAIDPTGAIFGLMESDADDGLEVWGETGAPCWVEVMTRDVPTDLEFYPAVFGWSAKTEDRGHPAYTTFSIAEEDAAGLLAMPPMVPAEAPAHWMVYFMVDDCAATLQTVVALGGKALVPATEIGIGRFAVAEDPQGAVFSLFESR